MIKTSGLFLILLLLFGKVYAQNTDITGKLIDKETHLPIPNATVTAYDGKTVVYHTISDSTGIFRIPPNLFKQVSHIKFSSLNYNEYALDVKAGDYGLSKQSISLGTFSLNQRQIELKEVKIKSSKRYRDTSKIDLSDKKFERSYMIDDFFSKESGFTKNDKGQIYYKGKLVTDLVVNGGSFFGKNNTEIYQLLPALVLDNIEIVETNIDSVTNTTLQAPQLKINLKFKDKYDKGKLGNINLGIGTAQRYVANTGLYSYKKAEQVSLSLNSNNLNIADNTIVEPKVDFAANGNNSVTNSTKFTYRNLYANKIEVNFSVKGKLEDRKFTSESDRQETDANIFSKTFNSSVTKSFSIDDGNFNVHYLIDTLNTLDVTQTFNHLHTRQSDSLNYIIKQDTSSTFSGVTKSNNTTNNLYSTTINYQKKFSSKKGRLLTIEGRSKNNIFTVNELDNVNSLVNQKPIKYYIKGIRQATQNNYTLNTNYTEPLSDSAYVNLFIIYERDRVNYQSQVSSDTSLNGFESPARITNNYIKPGFSYQRLFRKVSVDIMATGITDIRTIVQGNNYNTQPSFNFDLNLKLNYKLSKKKSIAFNYSAATDYANLQQLTSLNNTFDLIAQTTSNIYLKPQQKNSFKLDYSVKPNDSENIILSGQFDHYSSVFGYRIGTDITTALQTSQTDNLGSSNGAQLSFSFLKSISGSNFFNYTNAIGYQEAPVIISNKLVLNNSIANNQSLSTSITVVKSVFSVSPVLSSSYTRYFYQTSTINILTLTYYDKLSLQLKGFELNLFPLYNYNHSISTNHSFSTNGELRKTFFKKYATVWLQAYDIFNSFKYYNNNIGGSYFQSVKYSNVQRYIILGLSFKFNNIK